MLIKFGQVWHRVSIMRQVERIRTDDAMVCVTSFLFALSRITQRNAVKDEIYLEVS